MQIRFHTVSGIEKVWPSSQHCFHDFESPSDAVGTAEPLDGGMHDNEMHRHIVV